MMERDYVGLSEASSSAREAEEEEEIELGLSLGAKKVTAGKIKAAVAAAAGWGRILTAKDFPAAMGSRASPPSSSSSVSSSEGTKRVADNDGAASNSPPSQALVGWPPIRAFRINNTVANKDNNATSDAEAIANKKNNHDDGSKNDRIVSKNQYKRGCGNVGVGVTRFIKVNMDGDPIGRKVDLGAHRSYETLALALEMMFHKPTTTGLSSSAPASKLLDGSSEFALTYEDRDGDWMLVGDVPWGMFLDMVKRLRIMRTSDANGLAPRFQSSTGGLLRRNPT